MPPNLIFKELSSEQMIADLKDFDFISRFQICSVTLKKTILPKSFARLSQRAQVKVYGEIWKIHLYDRDPFPSNPHAHNIETNLKLHLGTGELVKKRQLVSKITKKIYC